jgi:hypothetical protein
VRKAIALGLGILLAMLAAPAAPISAQDASTIPDSSHVTRDHLLIVGAAAFGAATFNQATAMPSDWKRTWAGYGARVSDQLGFATVEETTRVLLVRAMPWRAVPQPCAGARAGRALLARVWSASGCAIRSTFVARDARGGAHLNTPLLGGVVTASAASLAWRPERKSAAKGRVFVATRIGVVLGGTTASEAWRVLRAR